MLVSASSFAFYILQENAGIIITVILLLLLDIILVFLIIWLKNRSFWLSKTSLYALMSFIFLTALWLLTDSPILQLYVSGSLRIVLLSFCSFMLMPIPLLVFINDALKLRCRSLTCFSFYCWEIPLSSVFFIRQASWILYRCCHLPIC